MASGALLPLAIHLPLQALEQVDPTIPTVAASSLPVAPPPVGLPQLQPHVSCAALQQRIRAAVGGESGVWSISVADARGRLLADVNGTRARIPASNQKLISTAIALDRLGPDYRLPRGFGARPMAHCRSPAKVIPTSTWLSCNASPSWL